MKGTDFLTFGVAPATDISAQKYSADVVLMSVEVIAQFTGTTAKPRLQDAIDDLS